MFVFPDDDDDDEEGGWLSIRQNYFTDRLRNCQKPFSNINSRLSERITAGSDLYPSLISLYLTEMTTRHSGLVYLLINSLTAVTATNRWP